MTNLELLNYALAGVQHYTDIIAQYEKPSPERDAEIIKLKSNRRSIESQINRIKSAESEIVEVLH